LIKIFFRLKTIGKEERTVKGKEGAPLHVESSGLRIPEYGFIVHCVDIKILLSSLATGGNLGLKTYFLVQGDR
jgi:hypothetical protein